MQSEHYFVEYGDECYYVVGPQGEVVSYVDFEKAVVAAREFAQKCFPEHWDKIPPAMRAAKQKYHT